MTSIDALFEIRDILNSHLKIANKFKEEYTKDLEEYKGNEVLLSIRKADIRYCEGMEVISESTIKKIDEILEKEINTGVSETSFNDLPIPVQI